MPVFRFAAAFLGIALAPVAVRAQDDEPRRDGRWPVPPDARVSVELDKKTFFLGENIVLHYVVENTGKTPFQVFTGCDGRNGVRALRFKVTATDETGVEAADPFPVITDHGGLGGEHEVHPGQKHYESVPLYPYRRLERPGVYTIRVWHDLGWEETGDRVTPAAEVTLTVVMPTPKQAREVAEATYRLPRPRSIASGEKRPPYPDFAVFQQAVYLPVFAPRAKAGCPKALEAIASIADPEATRTLIELTGHKDEAFGREALEALMYRLPIPDLEEQFTDEQYRWLTDKSWRPEFTPAVRRIGRGRLQGTHPRDLQAGAHVMFCLGDQEDLPAVIRGLDTTLAGVKSATLDDRTEWKLRDAALEMMRRGVRLPGRPRSPGERLLFARAIEEVPGYRPAGWEKTYARLLQDDLPFVRDTALRGLPCGPPPELAELLPALLRDPDVVVRTSACWACLKVNSDELQQPLLDVLATARDAELMRSAHMVAFHHALVPRFDVLRVLVRRLGEPGMARRCLEYLGQIVEDESTLKYSDDKDNPYCLAPKEVVACQRAWWAFLKTREKELAAGKTYTAGELPAGALFPRVRFWRDLPTDE
jgi:HEAT repeat protein